MILQKIKEFSKRYLPAEIVGTLTAIGAASIVHVFSDNFHRRAFSRHGASPDRRRLVGGHAPCLRTSRLDDFPVARDFVPAHRAFRKTHLLMDVR